MIKIIINLIIYDLKKYLFNKFFILKFIINWILSFGYKNWDEKVL
jgi:hypothetical protein